MAKLIYYDPTVKNPSPYLRPPLFVLRTNRQDKRSTVFLRPLTEPLAGQAEAALQACNPLNQAGKSSLVRLMELDVRLDMLKMNRDAAVYESACADLAAQYYEARKHDNAFGRIMFGLKLLFNKNAFGELHQYERWQLGTQVSRNLRYFVSTAGEILNEAGIRSVHRESTKLTVSLMGANLVAAVVFAVASLLAQEVLISLAVPALILEGLFVKSWLQGFGFTIPKRTSRPGADATPEAVAQTGLW